MWEDLCAGSRKPINSHFMMVELDWKLKIREVFKDLTGCVDI